MRRQSAWIELEVPIRAGTQKGHDAAGQSERSSQDRRVFRRFHFACVPRTGGKLKSAGGRDFANLLLLVARGKIGSLS